MQCGRPECCGQRRIGRHDIAGDPTEQRPTGPDENAETSQQRHQDRTARDDKRNAGRKTKNDERCLDCKRIRDVDAGGRQFGGGQVDISNGNFVFEISEAYLIEQGEITKPVKGAMLIGNGPTDLHRISMIGNDFALDPGIGTCGKNGQGVPVGVGQPTLRMDGLTVGGTAA